MKAGSLTALSLIRLSHEGTFANPVPHWMIMLGHIRTQAVRSDRSFALTNLLTCSFLSIGCGRETVSFPLSAVIPGWTEGLQLMREGGKATLAIPSDIGYGAVR